MSVYTITLQAGTDQFCDIAAEPDKVARVVTKAFLRFAIPSALRGAVPTAATLYIYTTGVASGTRATVPVKSTVDAWSGASTVSALNALALSATLDSKQVSAAGAWSAFDVLGDSSGGMIEACAASRNSVTFVPVYSGTPTLRRELLAIASIGVSPLDGVEFDYPGNPADGLHLPYLVVTADNTIRYPRPGCAVGGLMY